MTPETLQKIKEKNDLRDKARKAKSSGVVDTTLQEAYKKSRNQCNNLVTSEHRKLTGTHLDGNSTMNQVWKSVNKILAPRQTAKPLTIEVENVKIDDPTKVANELNKWFKQKVEDLVKGIYKPEMVDPFSRLKAKMKLKKIKFKLQPVDVHEVLAVLQKLKNKTSCGLDEFSSEMLKMCKEELAGPLTLIINRSICSGVFPKKMESSKSKPPPKKRKSNRQKELQTSGTPVCSRHGTGKDCGRPN